MSSQWTVIGFDQYRYVYLPRLDIHGAHSDAAGGISSVISSGTCGIQSQVVTQQHVSRIELEVNYVLAGIVIAVCFEVCLWSCGLRL